MTKSDWEKRLLAKQREEKALWKKIGEVQLEIHDCFVNIEAGRQREQRMKIRER